MGDSVKENDLVTMTCAHAFPKLSHSITFHRVEGNVFELKAQTLFMKNDLNIALLVVKSADCASYVNFLMMIRFIVVRHCYKWDIQHIWYDMCLLDVSHEYVNNIEPLHGVTYGSYDSTSFHTMLNYRMMVHI